MKGNINGNQHIDKVTLENVKAKLSQQISALPSALFLSPRQKQLPDYQSMELKSPGSNFMTSRGSTTHCDSNFKSVGVLSTSSMSLAQTAINSPAQVRKQNYGRKTIFNHHDPIPQSQQQNSNNHSRHVSILSGADNNNNKLNNKSLKQKSQIFEENSYLEQSEAPQAKIRIKSSTQTASQISLGSRDISTAAEFQYQNETTQPHSYQGNRPDSSTIHIKNNNYLNKHQQSFEITEEYSPFNQNQHLISPSFHSQINSRPFSNTQRFTSSVYFQNIEHDYRPKTSQKNNNSTKSTMDLKQRPQTGAAISEFNCRRRKNIENIQNFQQVNTLENKKKLEAAYTRPMTASSRGQSTPKDTQKGQKKRNSCFRSSLFEDEKLLKAFQQQIQKAVDKIQNSSPAQIKNQFFEPTQPVTSNFKNIPLQITIKADPYQHQTLQQSPTNIDLGYTNFSGGSTNNNNNLGNNLLNLPTSATPSNTTLMESGKNAIRIISEMEAEMRMEQKDFVQHLISPEQRPIVYMAAFQKIEKLIEIKDIVLLAENLLFLAHLAALVDDFDNACFFLLQTKIMSDMSRKIGEMKSQIFIQFGDLCIKTGRYTQALSFYKKALQYSWFYNQNDKEVLLFEKLGIAYFYKQDVNLSDFYHTRFISSLNEFQDSPHRNTSQESIGEYNLRLEYNLTSITPILMVHMQLPVQYSVDKAAHSLRESFLKTEMAKKKRSSNVDEQLSSLFRESQQEVENFMSSRMKVFKIANADKIIQQLLDDREFIYQMDTPTFFAHPQKDDENGEDQNVPSEVAACQRDYTHKKVDMLIHHSMSVFTTQDSRKKKKEWVAPIMKKTAYDISKLGPVSDPRPSQRVFEDPTKYKLSLEKKISVLAKQKIDYNTIMEKVNYIVSNNQKFHEAMHQRVRVSHVSPNRFDPLKYNTPFYTINQANRAYNGFMLKLREWKDRKNKEML